MHQEIRDALQKSGSVIDITTTGRKSGEARRIEIVFHNFGGTVYISGFPRPQKRSWLANLEAHPDFTFHLKNDVKADLAATARSITGAAERRPILEQVKSSQEGWKDVDIEDAVKMAPLVEVMFKD
ncbi:MAG TPA: nitroreductase family deazaflavin-dependent oxidoreductase [Dehalococcoidia bacterium]|nr:nitroreductase family deazaflavin-dependent oxidoreductase [Dehalococcoidia bacterium]